MNDFPNYYKIISIEMYVSSHKKRIARKTNDLLDMLSAIGGLFASLNNLLREHYDDIRLLLLSAHDERLIRS